MPAIEFFVLKGTSKLALSRTVADIVTIHVVTQLSLTTQNYTTIRNLEIDKYSPNGRTIYKSISGKSNSSHTLITFIASIG